MIGRQSYELRYSVVIEAIGMLLERSEIYLNVPMVSQITFKSL